MFILENYYHLLHLSDPTCCHVGVVVVFTPALVVPVEGVEASVGGQVILMA